MLINLKCDVERYKYVTCTIGINFTIVYYFIEEVCLTFVSPCFASIIVNDDQEDATILVYLFIRNQLYMFRAMFSPIIRST